MRKWVRCEWVCWFCFNCLNLIVTQTTTKASANRCRDKLGINVFSKRRCSSVYGERSSRRARHSGSILLPESDGDTVKSVGVRETARFEMCHTSESPSCLLYRCCFFLLTYASCGAWPPCCASLVTFVSLIACPSIRLSNHFIRQLMRANHGTDWRMSI